jgi:hypothetical protein
MRSFSRVALAATIIAVAAAGASYAQDRGPQLPSNTIHPVLKNIAERMGLIRGIIGTSTLGQVNLVEMVGTGSIADLEAANPGQPAPVREWRWAVSFNMNSPGGAASRMDYTNQAGQRTIRVVKGNRAWNEAWTATNRKTYYLEPAKTLTTMPVDAAIATTRAQLIWTEPHAFIQAAAFAAARKTPDGKDGNPRFEIGEEGGRRTITVEIYGNLYKATLGPAPAERPLRIETDLKVAGGTKKFIATFTDWRASDKPDDGFNPVIGSNVLDKFHNGTYWPSTITWELGGAKVLEVTLSEGWANPYIVFPDPELLARVQ